MKTLPVETMSALSTEWVPISVIGPDKATQQNMLTYTAYIAFPKQGVQPVTNDWHVATWQVRPDCHWALCKVGPNGGIQLPPDRYDVWIKVVTNEEIPVEMVYQLVVA